MISHCNHCKKPIQLSDSHRVKIENALTKLKPGQNLKFPCPNCKKTLEVGPESSKKGKPKPPVNEKPVSEKPANKEKKETPQAPEKAGKTEPKKAVEMPKPVNPPPKPPKPPDIGWLTTGKLEEKAVIEDVPTAMILMPEGEAKTIVSKVLEDDEYQLFFPENVQDAIDRMRFKTFAVVVYHCTYEEKSLEESEFHAHMKNITMNKRRYMIYLLIGPDFHTLYDLEALANSANIVVNDNEVKSMNFLWKKGKGEYEALFNPFTAVLKAHGKR